MQGDQAGKKGRREVWGRVPKDWEMGGVRLRVGSGFGDGVGVVFRRRGWEGWSARAEGGAAARAEEGAPPCVLLPSPSSRDFPLAAWPLASPRRAPQSRFVSGGRAGARPA